MFRRGVAWLVAVVVVVVPGLLVVPSAVAADPVVENVVSFSDVPVESQFAKEISWLAASGISTGWDTGGVRQYRPLESIARNAMAAFLYRHAGSPAFTPPTVSPFTDVPVEAAFYKEITWLASEGISTG
ncbi:S-layer homology domain-containing protein, partial [Paenarthrobacter sp. TYUT067]